MCDLLPGYVSTFANPTFNSSRNNLVIVGQENGKIYGSFATKEDLFKVLSTKKVTKTKMCYYSSSIRFSKAELTILDLNSIFLVNDENLKNICESFQKIARLIYM